MMAGVQSVVPRYLAGFNCIGGECPDTCCAGWDVTVDKAQFKKLRAAPDAAIERAVREHIKPVPGMPTELHAKIVLRPDKSCPMLDGAKLCSIQKRLGPAWLPRICNDFPRNYFYVGDHPEVFATFACPEAARLGLLAADAFAPAEVALPFPPGKPVPYRCGFKGTQDQHSDPLQRHFGRIRDFFWDTLRIREYSLSQRLLLLGLLARRLGGVAFLDDPSRRQIATQDRAMQTALVEYAGVLVDGSLRQLTPSRSAQEPESQLREALLRQSVLQGLTAVRMSAFTTANHPGFLQCVEQAFNGFGFDSEDAVGSAARFEAAERDWFGPYDRAHPHILENFLLNEIGGSFFPLGKERHGIEREWMAIMVLYALVRFYLIGLAGFYREQFSGEHYVRLIQSVCRVISHNAGFLKQVHLELGKHGMDNLASIAILIRE